MPSKPCGQCNGSGVVLTKHGEIKCTAPGCEWGFVEYTPPPKPPKKG